MTTATTLPASPLAALRASLAGAGWTAESPLMLDPEAEMIAREERLVEL